MNIIDFFNSYGFTVVESDTPLHVSLNQLEFPAAILSIDNVVISDTTKTSYMVSLLWPSQNIENLHKGILIGEAIHASFNTQVIVSSIVRHDPECSGALLTFSVVTNTHHCNV